MYDYRRTYWVIVMRNSVYLDEIIFILQTIKISDEREKLVAKIVILLDEVSFICEYVFILCNV